MATQATGLQSTQTRDILGYMYQRVTQDPMNWAGQVGMYIPSDQAVEKHRWLGMAPMMREWVGGRQTHKPNAYGINVENKKFEATMDIAVDDIRRDKTKIVEVRINDMIAKANNHWAKLLSDLLNVAESTLCYDGKNWVATDHNESGSNQSNSISFAAATGTSPTVTEMVDAILESVKQIYSFKDDKGDPTNQDSNNFLIMVPLTYWTVAQKAVKQELIGSGETNVLGTFNLSVVHNPRLTWTTKMMTFATDAPIKSAILQDEDMVRASAKAEGSEYAHDTDHYQYGVKAVRNVAPGFWQSCCMTTFT